MGAASQVRVEGGEGGEGAITDVAEGNIIISISSSSIICLEHVSGDIFVDTVKATAGRMAEVEVGIGDACAVVEDESDACAGGTDTDEAAVEDSDAGAKDASAASLRLSFLSCRF